MLLDYIKQFVIENKLDWILPSTAVSNYAIFENEDYKLVFNQYSSGEIDCILDHKQHKSLWTHETTKEGFYNCWVRLTSE